MAFDGAYLFGSFSLILLFVSMMKKNSTEKGKLYIVGVHVSVCELSVLKNETSNNSAFGSCHGTVMVNGFVKRVF